MAMTITISIDDQKLEDHILGILTEDKVYAVQKDTPAVEIQETVTEDTPTPPREGTAAALLNDASQPGQNISTDLNALIRSMKLKRAQTVTLAEGAKGKDGDEVMLESGESGVIAACYRGKVIVQFEDGSGEVVDATTVTLIPQEDEEPAKAAPVTNGHDTTSTAAATISEDKANALKTKANGLIQNKKATPPEVFKLLGEYGVDKFHNLPASAFDAMDKSLDVLGNVAEPSEHGF